MDEAKDGEIKCLFEAHDAAVDEEEALGGQIGAARKKRSDLVRQIHAIAGGGPFRWKGQDVIIAKRGETWYFRGRNRVPPKLIG